LPCDVVISANCELLQSLKSAATKESSVFSFFNEQYYACRVANQRILRFCLLLSDYGKRKKIWFAM